MYEEHTESLESESSEALSTFWFVVVIPCCVIPPVGDENPRSSWFRRCVEQGRTLPWCQNCTAEKDLEVKHTPDRLQVCLGSGGFTVVSKLFVRVHREMIKHPRNLNGKGAEHPRA